MIFLLSVTQVIGQNYPIQVTIILKKPYSLRLSDYTDPVLDRINAKIFAGDVGSNLQVRLRIRIEANGITIQTKASYKPAPILLEGGQMETFTAADLAGYFHPANLDFNGIDQRRFSQTGQLPEGYYNFKIDVIEYVREKNLSDPNAMGSTVWLVLNDPPRWQLPAQNETVTATFPQNLLFNWLPMHTGSPNAAFNVAYEFTMVEIYPAGRNPNDAMNSQAHFYQETTNATSFMMGPGKPQMVPGRYYAVRLRAVENDGLDLFKNNGYSEVLMFKFGNECLAPTAITAKPQNYKSAKAEWTSSPGNTEFLFQYREKGQNVWYSATSLFGYYTINDLTPSKSYEYQLQGQCGSINSPFSIIGTLTMPEMPKDAFQCNPNASLPAIPAGEAKATLVAGETVSFYDYKVEVSQVTASNAGVFEGSGIMVMPFLNNAKMQVQFRNLRINPDNNAMNGSRAWVTGGAVYALDDKTRNDIDNKIKEVKDGVEVIQNYLTEAENKITEANDILNRVQNLPADARKLIEDGRNLITQGKAMAQAGNATEGQTLIDQGKNKLKEGAKKAIAAAGTLGSTVGSVTQLMDSLSNIFTRMLRARKDTSKADSSNKNKEIIILNKSYQELKADFNETDVDYSIDQKNDEENEETFDNTEQDFEVVEADTTRAYPDIIALNKKANKIDKLYFDLGLINSTIAFTIKYLNNNEMLNSLISNFQADAAKFLKDYTINTISGKQQNSLKDEVKLFLDKKVNEELNR